MATDYSVQANSEKVLGLWKVIMPFYDPAKVKIASQSFIDGNVQDVYTDIQPVAGFSNFHAGINTKAVLYDGGSN